MKTRSILIGLSLIVMVVSGVKAQTSKGERTAAVPEFRMFMAYTEPTYIHGDGRQIGYDAAASDSIDDAFGEADYPGSDGGPFPDFFFEPPTKPYYYGPIMILHKPATTSFTLDYKMHIAAEDWSNPNNLPTLHWDRSSIPAAIKGMYVTSLSDSTILLVDLLKADSIRIPQNKADTWRRTRIRLYYNVTPPTLTQASVAMSTTGLLQNLIATPNPSSSTPSLVFNSVASGEMSIMGYDGAGRLCLHTSISFRDGENVVPLAAAQSLHGPILLHIEATCGSQHESKTVMIARE